MIAQQVEQVIPSAVETRDDGIKAVQYHKIIPLLVESVKDQQNQIAALQAENKKILEEVQAATRKYNATLNNTLKLFGFHYDDNNQFGTDNIVGSRTVSGSDE